MTVRALCSKITYGHKKKNYKGSRMDIVQTDTCVDVDCGNNPLDNIIGAI